MNKIKETQLKQIEKDLIKKFSDYLVDNFFVLINYQIKINLTKFRFQNIDEDISADMYLSFTESSLNPLIVSSDLLEVSLFRILLKFK